MLKIPASFYDAAAATQQLLPIAIYHNLTLIGSVHRAVCLQESDSSAAHEPAGPWKPFMVFSYLNSSPIPEPRLGHPGMCLPPAHCLPAGFTAPPGTQVDPPPEWEPKHSREQERIVRCHVLHYCNPATRLTAIYQRPCQPRVAL